MPRRSLALQAKNTRSCQRNKSTRRTELLMQTARFHGAARPLQRQRALTSATTAQQRRRHGESIQSRRHQTGRKRGPCPPKLLHARNRDLLDSSPKRGPLRTVPRPHLLHSVLACMGDPFALVVHRACGRFRSIFVAAQPQIADRGDSHRRDAHASIWAFFACGHGRDALG
jgi:hypothetical protein